MEILVWIGFSQSMFEGILIVTKKQPSISDKILSAWLFLLAISFLFSGMEYQIYGQPLLTNAFLLINPAFYLYIRSLIKRHFSLKWIQLLHIVPFVFFQVVIILFKLTLGGDSLSFNTDGVLFSVLFIATTILSWAVYNILSIVMVYKHRKNLMNEFSRVGSGTAKQICENAALLPNTKPRDINRDMAEKLIEGIKKTKIISPPIYRWEGVAEVAEVELAGLDREDSSG